MRSLPVLVLLALMACATDEERAREPAAPTAPAPEPAPEKSAARTFSEPVGDAVGAGLDLSDTRVAVDADGVLVIDVAIPDAVRREPAKGDHVQVYLDLDRDHENNGYDVRLVLFGGAFRPFTFQRFEGGRWRDRTPASYEASFDHGVHIRVPAADVGVPESFDFFVASIDESTGKVSDLSPDGALWQRWTYTR
jgi:hypothetical protein